MAFPTIYTTKTLCRIFPVLFHVLRPAASFPGQTTQWPTTVHPTCCYTHCFPSSSLLSTFTTHLFPGLPWLPASTPCFMPGSYRRALRQRPPRLCISAASGSWAVTAGPRIRITTTCKLIPAQVSGGQKLLHSEVINQCELRCLSVAPSRHTSA